MGIYDRHMPAYADAGLPVFPVNTRAKRPAVRGWQNADPRRARGWAKTPRLADCDGIGIVMGRPSGITEIDVDAAGEAWLSLALDRFGQTPVVIRTASGKGKLWYRHNGEPRRTPLIKGIPIDLLGDGFSVAPPSWREDLAANYTFIRGGLDDLACLPIIPAHALSDGFSRAAEGVLMGERNSSLWRYCMTQARACDDVEALIDVAVTWSDAFPDPLGHPEAERCARSAWQYQITGRNYLGLKKPQLNEGDRIMDALIDEPEAFTLYQMFRRWHSNRPMFAISPRAMSAAGSPPWHFSRIARARDVLVDRGAIVELVAPAQGKHPGQYRFGNETSDFVHNHNTPFPPALVGRAVTGQR